MSSLSDKISTAAPAIAPPNPQGSRTARRHPIKNKAKTGGRSCMLLSAPPYSMAAAPGVGDYSARYPTLNNALQIPAAASAVALPHLLTHAAAAGPKKTDSHRLMGDAAAIGPASQSLARPLVSDSDKRRLVEAKLLLPYGPAAADIDTAKRIIDNIPVAHRQALILLCVELADNQAIGSWGLDFAQTFSRYDFERVTQINTLLQDCYAAAEPPPLAYEHLQLCTALLQHAPAAPEGTRKTYFAATDLADRAAARSLDAWVAATPDAEPKGATPRRDTLERRASAIALVLQAAAKPQAQSLRAAAPLAGTTAQTGDTESILQILTNLLPKNRSQATRLSLQDVVSCISPSVRPHLLLLCARLYPKTGAQTDSPRKTEHTMSSDRGADVASVARNICQKAELVLRPEEQARWHVGLVALGPQIDAFGAACMAPEMDPKVLCALVKGFLEVEEDDKDDGQKPAQSWLKEAQARLLLDGEFVMVAHSDEPASAPRGRQSSAAPAKYKSFWLSSSFR